MSTPKVQKRLEKVARTSGPGAVPRVTTKAATASGPSAADLADAIVVLGGLDTLETQPDGDAIAFKAAATLVQAGPGAAGMAKAMSAPAQTLIAEAREMLAKSPAERYQHLSLLAKMRDGGNPEQFRAFQPLYSKEAARVAAVTPITVPALAKVSGPKPDPDALTKAAAQAAADIRTRLDQALEAARARQGGPRR